jgi:diketogulonate reductase-like aldo/keto reductase
MSEATRAVQGVSVPVVFYGTAWKEDATEALVRRALAAGFRAIDTANQRKHYHEAAVGDAVSAALSEGNVAREDLFLQTKFTSVDGQDHRLPYDPKAPPAVQVEQSLERSLAHLHTTYVDCLVLHGPSRARGLHASDWEVWRAMEGLHREGRARLIGASNVSLDQVQALSEEAVVPPAFVQNRCYARTGWDRAVRELCGERGIGYQPFSLLTANTRELQQPAVAAIARRAGRTVPQVVFRFALQLGMFPLTGTTSEAHMRQDLECVDGFTLGEDDLRAIERCAG